VSLRIVAIIGPTACAKTRLGVEVAHRLGSEIISADSRQVYLGLDIGSGKDLEEYSMVEPAVPYHLIDVADPRDVYSVFHFQRDCHRLLRLKARQQRFASGRVPLLMVGGSGLYVEAVLRGYRIADVPENSELRQRLGKLPLDELRARLEREDPALAARSDRTNRKRVLRALEIAEHGRRAELRFTEPLGLKLAYKVFGVEVEPEQLRRRIAARVDRRLGEGMVEEVQSLLDAGISPQRLEMLGLEYREISAHLLGRSSFDQMVSDLKRRIGQLAKRQRTWFRGMERRGIPIRWIAPGDSATVLQAIDEWQSGKVEE
jgi:tRNA dimethylallyltransferase